MKNKILSVTFLLINMQNCFASFASGANHIIDQVSPNTNIGVSVVDLTSGKTIFWRNDKKLFTPASNMKLFSDAAALMVLGPDYRFKNELAIGVANLNRGVLKGNLYLRLSGDPSFSQDRLAKLINSLKRWQIKDIQGDIVIESPYANITPYAPGGVIKDRSFGYGAPIAPLILDANRMLITVNPADRAELPAVIELGINQGSFHINNQIITKPQGTRCGVSFTLDNNDQLTAKGCVAVGQWAYQQIIPIKNPQYYAQSVIKHLLKKIGIAFHGNVVLGHTQSDNMVLATDYSKSIAQLMADTLKPSDNLYADSLFLHTANILNKAPLNWDDAQNVIKDFITRQTGISLQNSVLIDGSGLSRLNKLSPDQTVRLLQFLYEHFPLTYEYISALPISGRDGTLQKRFKRPDQQDMVRAKTGTMSGIISLSGYLYTANGHTLAFAIFINTLRSTPPNVAGKSRYLVDALANYFLKQKPSNSVWSQFFAKSHRIQYQTKPTEAELRRWHDAHWRQLETLVKRALQGQAVTVIYRGNELVLWDKQDNINSVLQALKRLRQKYRFAAAVASSDKPELDNQPLVVWQNENQSYKKRKRTWLIRETIDK
jgi:D-alanyl-D-alanine carboxypeptidase/D-alanyl-D-alanine-endopeptidase (penicillin-binding protein 4)